MWRRFRGGALLAAAACQGVESSEVELQAAVNSCVERRQCAPLGGGSDVLCDTDLERCVSSETQFGRLLVELVPRNTEKRFGGYHFFLEHQVGAAGSIALLAESPAVVAGNFDLALGQPTTESGQTECHSRRMRFTFTPRERALGLPVPRYRTVSTRGIPMLVDDQVVNSFSIALPAGVYDVYAEDAHAEPDGYRPTPGCEQLVPQVVRGFRVEPASVAPRQRFEFRQVDIADFEEGSLGVTPVRTLQVLVPWRPGLSGWRLDVIHPVTGERLSTMSTVPEEPVLDEEGRVLVSVRMSAILSQASREALGVAQAIDYVAPGDWRLRLRPPQCGEGGCEGRAIAPTILVPLAVVEIGGVGQPAPISPIGPPLSSSSDLQREPEEDQIFSWVNLSAWTWARQPGGERATKLESFEGTVTFSANRLTEVADGVVSRYTTTVSIGNGGLVSARLPPGSYTARVVPAPSSGLAALEAPITVWPGNDTQAGQVLWVPKRIRLEGTLKLPDGRQLAGADVEAIATPQGGLEGLQAAESFQPRGARAILGADGRFDLEGADCLACGDAGEGQASYDLFIKPKPGSGWPWLIRPSILVGQAPAISIQNLGDFELSAPHPLRGTTQFQIGAQIEGLPFALLRFYALLDEAGEFVSDASLPWCVDVRDGSNCVRRALQVGQLRSDVQAAFELALPYSTQ